MAKKVFFNRQRAVPASASRQQADMADMAKKVFLNRQRAVPASASRQQADMASCSSIRNSPVTETAEQVPFCFWTRHLSFSKFNTTT